MKGSDNRRLVRARGEQKNLVRFRVGETCYAFEVANVEEVVHPVGVTPLPHMAPGVTGVFDHRGRVTPIVDLRFCFGLGQAQPLSAENALRGRLATAAKWLLMRTSRGLIGFVVDSVLDVVEPEDALSSAPHVGPGVARRAILGVFTCQGTLVFVLDEERLASVIADTPIPDQLPVD
ncbi:MAG: chemotaxis protein CheW [Polyangiaceae bacterium]